MIDLPLELREQLNSFFQEVDGSFEVTDMPGAINFILEHGDKYPSLYDLIDVDMDKVVEMFERTGVLPPGIKLVRKTPIEGTNVTKLEVLHGPIEPKSDEN